MRTTVMSYPHTHEALCIEGCDWRMTAADPRTARGAAVAHAGYQWGHRAEVRFIKHTQAIHGLVALTKQFLKAQEVEICGCGSLESELCAYHDEHLVVEQYVRDLPEEYRKGCP